ncbi:unnamed protein product [Camellia sinensis]
MCQMILLHSCWPKKPEDLCGEARCIEAEESNRSSSPEQNTEISESIVARIGDTTDQEFVSPPLKEDSMLSYIPHFVAHSHEKPSPWPLTEYMSGSQSLKLTKSRSCKASLMTSPYSPWFEKVENNDNEHTPPNGLSRKGSQSSIRSVAAIDLEAHRGRTSTDDNITSVNTCIVRMEEKAELQQEKQVADNPYVSLVHRTSCYIKATQQTRFMWKWSSGGYRSSRIRFLEVARASYSLACFEYTVMRFSARDRRLIHGSVSGFVSGASESCGMGYSSPCTHLHLH